MQLLAGAICGMEHHVMGFSANMMMLGMEVFKPIDILMHTSGEHYRDENPVGYVKHLHNILREVHHLAAKKLRIQLKYQQRNYDLKLQETHYEVGDFIYWLNGASKTGESKKLKPVWVVLFRVKDHKECVLHHDHLKWCEDCHIPLWLCKLCHSLLDLDTTIPYNEAEQEDLSPPSVPKLNVEDSQSPPSEDEAPEDIPVSSTPACSSPAGLDASVPPWDVKASLREASLKILTFPILILWMTMLPLMTLLLACLQTPPCQITRQKIPVTYCLLQMICTLIPCLTMSYISMPKNILLPSQERGNLEKLAPCPL